MPSRAGFAAAASGKGGCASATGRAGFRDDSGAEGCGRGGVAIERSFGGCSGRPGVFLYIYRRNSGPFLLIPACDVEKSKRRRNVPASRQPTRAGDGYGRATHGCPGRTPRDQVRCPANRAAFERRCVPAGPHRENWPLRSVFRISRNTLGIPPDSRRPHRENWVSRAPPPPEETPMRVSSCAPRQHEKRHPHLKPLKPTSVIPFAACGRGAG